MGIIEHHGLAVECIDEGSGPTVVLSHSSASGNRQWRVLIARLQQHHRVIAPNLHGYGSTTAWRGDRPFTIADAADVLVAVCASVDEPVMAVGHSWGASALMAAAATLGERVTDLVVHEPMLPALLRGSGGTGWSEAESLYGDVQQFGGAQDWLGMAERFFDYFNGDGSWSATPEHRQQLVAAAIAPNYHEWDAAMGPMTTADFATIRARTLLVRGSATRALLGEVADVLAAAKPDWDTHTMDGTGHMAPLTHADEFNDVVVQFLRVAS